MTQRRVRAWLAVAGLVLLGCSPAGAQTVGASLQGSLLDPSGSVVAGGTLELRNVGTGAAQTQVSDDLGRFRFPVLPPGEYELHVSAPGFQPMVRKGITLAVGQNAVIDVKLELGRTASEVSVSADASQINLT